MRRKKLSYFCLEAGFNPSRPFQTLLGREFCNQLEALHTASSDFPNPYIHYGTIYTKKELVFYLTNIIRVHGPKMLHFIAHGNQGLISLSDGQAATLDLLSKYQIGDSIIHFSTCLTVSDEEAVKRLMEATGTLLITGYKSLVYPVDGLIVDLIIITSILRKVKTLTTDSVFRATKFIRNKYEDICKREGFMYCRRGRKQDSAQYIWYNREKRDY